jgi:hypothetical protein
VSKIHQIHLYEGIVNRVWARFLCRLVLVQGGGVVDERGGILEFAVPPSTERDIEVLYRWLHQYRRQQQH